MLRQADDTREIAQKAVLSEKIKPGFRFSFRCVVLAACSVTLLAGCATTPEELASQAEADALRISQQFGSACNRLGYLPDTDPWRNCLLALAQRDMVERQMQLMRHNTWGPRYRVWW